ncbi:MAG TPA: FUSC family protein [Aliidongia sp.]|nr:FUSC family protein [Aliidongia sp.]
MRERQPIDDRAIVTNPFTSQSLIFAFNCYLATILALFVAFRLDLPNPWWAMATVFLTSQPIVGAVLSKAFYRIVGTLIGVTASLVIVPNFSDAPELMFLGVAGWLGLCLYHSLLDRTPRAYIFALAGYTVALVGLPLAINTDGAFDAAVARSEEIVIGVLAAGLVHSVVFPRSVVAAMQARLTVIVNDACRWTGEGLRTLAKAPPAPARQRIAVDLTELSLMATNLRFEGPFSEDSSRALHALENRLVSLLPLVSAIEDRLETLAADGPVDPALHALMDEIGAWAEKRDPRDPGEPGRLIEAARQLSPPLHPDSGWAEVLQASLIARTIELIRAWDESLVLLAAVRDPLRPPGREVRRLLELEPSEPRALHVDRGVAALSGLTAALTILAMAYFAVATRWETAATAIGLAAVICSLWATADDPTPMAWTFTIWFIIAIPLSMFYEFAVLPSIDGFVMLSAALFPVLMGIGIYMAQPQHTLKALPVAVGVSSGLALQPTFQADFATFANINAAGVAGTICGAVALGLMRVIPVRDIVRRILRAGWRDLSALAVSRKVQNRQEWSSRMLDRLGLLIPRLARLKHDELETADALRDLRLGVSIIDLRNVAADLDAAVRRRIDTLMATLSDYYRTLGRGRRPPLSPGCVEDIDAAMAAVLRLPDPTERTRGIVATVGLRRNLFPEAPAYQPAETP